MPIINSLAYCESSALEHAAAEAALESRTPMDNTSVHVINVDIQDNHEEATIGAFLVCEMMSMVRHLVLGQDTSCGDTVCGDCSRILAVVILFVVTVILTVVIRAGY
uniref:RNA polymerase II subunit A C-terminal domain phosphatase SSU72 n=1 Tax=Timema cristinae TaxID=61476 RepID=A0A7R9CP43_TIMCR|nr:unnamed protein product [Timema cristinae]